MVRDSIREFEDPVLLGESSSLSSEMNNLWSVPPGYIEYYNKRTGDIYYEDLMTCQQWYTALDAESRLYFYTEDKETGQMRSEWSLPATTSGLSHEVRRHVFSRTYQVLCNQIVGRSPPGEDNPLDKRSLKEGVLNWRLKHTKKWSVSCVLLTRYFPHI